MLEINYHLKNRIMRRIYLVWFFRKLSSLFALETILFLMLTLWLTAYVSFSNIYRNAPSPFYSPIDTANFFATAFSETELIVKALFVAAFISIILLMKQTTKAVFKKRSPLHLAHQ